MNVKDLIKDMQRVKLDQYYKGYMMVEPDQQGRYFPVFETKDVIDLFGKRKFKDARLVHEIVNPDNEWLLIELEED